MTGKEFRKELKRLFKKLELDDIEIGVSNLSVLLVDSVNLSKLYDDDSLTREERDRIWEDRKQYRIEYDRDEDKLYAEERKPVKRNRIY